MPLKYNPLLTGKLDLQTVNLNDLADVNTAGTVDGKILTYQNGTWKPEAAASGGDMYKGTYDTNDDGIVDNSERLEGETLGSVQAHTVNAINILGTLTDANIPDVETLSYGFTFADAQIPTLDASKTISGTFDGAQIPNLGASKITSGTFVPERIPELPTTRINEGTFDLGRIPSIDDARIPNLETLGYGGAFAEGQIPNLAASKITTGTFNVNRIDTLDNLKGTVTAAKVAVLDADKITTGTFGIARIPTMDDAHVPDLDTLSYGAAFGTAQIPSIGAYKVTSGTLGIARIPNMDDAHIPDLETLSYGAVFGTAQIPSIGAYKVGSGTLNADRIPALPTARITSGTFNADRIPVLPTDRYGSAVLVSGTRSMTGDFDFAKHQAKAMALECLGSAPASPATAQMYYNIGSDKVMVYVA